MSPKLEAAIGPFSDEMCNDPKAAMERLLALLTKEALWLLLASTRRTEGYISIIAVDDLAQELGVFDDPD